MHRNLQFTVIPVTISSENIAIKSVTFFHSYFQLTACRMIPWAKANLNYTAQALIISAGKLSIPTKKIV